ncbi:putative oxidoreductase CipA-like protein [Microstroma glucosiphilum]|uniref:Putative oxidoreductase CipA-like protein n=1 Tax=Pseudomicrostroma glucosiphilum TaxID=1684307 RepID=A0A316TZ24_9BASI|nr:putative oxidoreductase CipA-like protein [Pseudomicrostroma glucosiphilum]PWN18377.1 putative oxidoreductase CipA-like protein [Pseudomicrostroma glucosiphilum]
MVAYQNIAIAGATGNLGPSIVRKLLNAGLNVIVLTRNGTRSATLPQSVKQVVVEYSSQQSLVAALGGIEALISTIPDHGAQPALIDAAIEAGVKRFISSDFGSDVPGNTQTASLPVFAGKAKTQAYLESKRDQIEYTQVVNGALLDWGIMVGFLIDVRGGPTRLFDGGRGRFSATTLAHVAQAVLGILQHSAETLNRAVYVQSAAVSQMQLLALAKQAKPSLKTETSVHSTAELEKGAYAILESGNGDIRNAMLDFIAVSIFREGYGGLFSLTDNNLLGIKELDEAELSSLVSQFV